MSWTAERIFIAFASILLIGVFIIENINGRFWLNDFKVYYMAGKVLIEGEPIYAQSFGLSSGFYKYSPFVAILFALMSTIPYATAAVIQFVLIASCIISHLLLLRLLIEKYVLAGPLKKPHWSLILAFVSVSTHYVRELHLGNVNVILVTLLVLSLMAIMKKKSLLAGVLFALVILFKPYFAILGIPLLLYKKWGTIRWTFIFVISMLISPSLILGWSENLGLHAAWLSAMAGHDVQLASAHSIAGMAKTFLGLSASTALSIVSILIPLSMLSFSPLLGGPRSNRDFIIMFLSIIALIPNMVTTDTEHFLMSSPLIFLGIATLREHKIRSLSILFGLLILAYAGNSTDILGRELSQTVDALGVLGIANLALIILITRSLKISAKSPTI